MSNTDFILIYLTVPNEAIARNIILPLLEQKLIACSNLLPKMQSFYEWEGKIHQEEEQILLLKTQKQHYEAIENIIKQQHPFQCPCILMLPIAKGNMNFLAWIQENTSPKL